MLFLLSLTLADLQSCSKLYPLSQTPGAVTEELVVQPRQPAVVAGVLSVVQETVVLVSVLTAEMSGEVEQHTSHPAATVGEVEESSPLRLLKQVRMCLCWQTQEVVQGVALGVWLK